MKRITYRTWQFAAGVAVMAAALAAAFVSWRAHVNADNDADHPTSTAITTRTLTLSERSQKDLQVFVNKESNIVAASAVDVDLVKNKRHTTYLYSEDPTFKKIWLDYLTHRAAAPAAFSSAASQNTRVTSIINGNFDCVLFKETLNYLYFPDAQSVIKYVCSISVPAGFDGSGDFVGFINFFMAEPPSDQEKKRLAKETIELSTAIYRRDIEQQPVK